MAKKDYYEYSDGPIGGELTVYRVYEAKQCTAKGVFTTKRCQGVLKHTGPHWYYGPSGWLEQWKDDKDIEGKWDWAALSTPPDHDSYIHPKDKQNEYFHHFDRREVVGKKQSEPLSPKMKKMLAEYEKDLKEQTSKPKKKKK